ncbi:MAG: hypothetical protein HKK67_10090, partial [Chlorobiaceae bacterium]|nr:hypothetical protein [Chlorobiaceae bacterium]
MKKIVLLAFLLAVSETGLAADLPFDSPSVGAKGLSHYKNTVLGLMLISHHFRSFDRISLFSRFFFSLPQSLIPFWYTVSMSI